MNWNLEKQASLTYHEQIIQFFTSRIANGDFPAGMKCPPQRLLATQFGVNRSTINTAMDELKANGLLETKVGSGTFISENPWSHILAQPKWQQHIDASLHKPNVETIQLINDYEQKSDMIRLGTGELSPQLLPTVELEQSLKEITFTSRDIGYSEPQGSLTLRQSLCTHLKRRNIHTSPQHILIVSGALQAFQLIALGLLERGSVVFQQQASYLNSIHPFQSAGMQMVAVNNDSNLLQTLQKAKRNRQGIYYAIPTLDNPTGRSWSNDEKTLVYDACKSLTMPIIEDDVYGDLLFEGKAASMKVNDDSGQILYVGSMSKTVSPGLRIGWIIGPEAVIKRLADVKMQTDYGSSAFSQAIVANWLDTGLYEQHILKLRQQLQQRADFMEQLLETYFKQYATWASPKGGFYIWLRFSKPIANRTLFDTLLKQKVLINPGYIYEPNDFHHLRLSYAYASFEEMEQGIIILSKVIEQYFHEEKS